MKKILLVLAFTILLFADCNDPQGALRMFNDKNIQVFVKNHCIRQTFNGNEQAINKCLDRQFEYFYKIYKQCPTEEQLKQAVSDTFVYDRQGNIKSLDFTEAYMNFQYGKLGN